MATSLFGIQLRGENLGKWQLFDVENTQPQTANYNGMIGSIPPRTQYHLSDVDFIPFDKNQVLVLIEPQKGKKYSSDHLYLFDIKQEEIISKIKLQTEIDMFEVEGQYLYVHSEEEDKRVKYRLSL